MARLFVGVWVPEDVTETLLSLPRKDQRGVRFVRPENWHITLSFLGDAHPDAGKCHDIHPRTRIHAHRSLPDHPEGEVVLTRANPVEAEDPLLGEFLNFLASDIASHPERLQPLDIGLVSRVMLLVAK